MHTSGPRVLGADDARPFESPAASRWIGKGMRTRKQGIIDSNSKRSSDTNTGRIIAEPRSAQSLYYDTYQDTGKVQKRLFPKAEPDAKADPSAPEPFARAIEWRGAATKTGVQRQSRPAQTRLGLYPRTGRNTELRGIDAAWPQFAQTSEARPHGSSKQSGTTCWEGTVGRHCSDG